MRLPALHRRCLFLAFAGLALTGLAWTWLDAAYGLGPADDEWIHTAQAWLGRTHGAFAMLSLIAFGGVAATHLPAALRVRPLRLSGVALIAVFGLLALSGYFLYYGSGEVLRAASAYAHMAVGVAAVAAFALHMTQA